MTDPENGQIIDLSAHVPELAAAAQETEPNISLSPDMFAGKWANAAQIQATEHEITLDFIHMGPLGQQGQVVARVMFSHLFFPEFCHAITQQASQMAEATTAAETITET